MFPDLPHFVAIEKNCGEEKLPGSSSIEKIWEDRIQPSLPPHMLMGGESLPTNFTPLQGYLLCLGGENSRAYACGRRKFTHLHVRRTKHPLSLHVERVYPCRLFSLVHGRKFLYPHTEKNMGTSVLHVYM